MSGTKRPRSRPSDKRAETPRHPAHLPPISWSDVRLVPGKGSAQRGGGEGGSYWHIYLGQQRVGNVFINVIEQPPIGQHASIQIHVNARQRGRHIGRVAYRLAAEASGHPAIFAHMRKSNVASQRAAQEAGFTVVDDQSSAQRTMVWYRGIAP